MPGSKTKSAPFSHSLPRAAKLGQFFEEPAMPNESTASPIKQKVHELADQLLETATWDDVIEEACFRKAVEAGIAKADRSEFAKHEGVRAAFAKLGVRLEA